MKDERTLRLTKCQLFWHYATFVLLLAFPVWATFKVGSSYISGTNGSRLDTIELLLLSYVCLIPAALFYFSQKRSLKFKELNLKLDAGSFPKAVLETAKELEWQVMEHSGNRFVLASGATYRSAGERITIIHEGNTILFNSISDPDKLLHYTSMGMNKRNQVLFVELLKVAIASKPLEKSVVIE